MSTNWKTPYREAWAMFREGLAYQLLYWALSVMPKPKSVELAKRLVEPFA